jgi:hypothetical protein
MVRLGGRSTKRSPTKTKIIMYTIQSGNTISISDRVAMFTTTSPDMRQCYVRAPYLFNARPVVTLTVSTEVSSQLLVVFGVEAPETPATGETLFKVSARFERGQGDDTVPYWCDFTMTGELAS